MHCITLQVSKKKKRNTCMLISEILHDFIILSTFLFHLFKGSTKTRMLCAKSTTCSPQLPEYLTVRNSQKQKQTTAKAAGLCIPFNEGDVHESYIHFKSEKMKVKVYKCFRKYA